MATTPQPQPKCQDCKVPLSELYARPVCRQCSCHDIHPDPHMLAQEYLAYGNQRCAWPSSTERKGESEELCFWDAEAVENENEQCHVCRCHHVCEAVSLCRDCFQFHRSEQQRPLIF